MYVTCCNFFESFNFYRVSKKKIGNECFVPKKCFNFYNTTLQIWQNAWRCHDTRSHENTHTHTYAHSHTLTHTHTLIHTHTHTHTHIHTHTHTYAHTHIDTHLHTFTSKIESNDNEVKKKISWNRKIKLKCKTKKCIYLIGKMNHLSSRKKWKCYFLYNQFVLWF